MLVLKSDNDPIIKDNGIDEEVLLQNPNVIVGKTKYGGHLGYYERYFSN